MEKDTRKQINEIVTIIKDNLDPISIFLFGSSSSGKSDSESDIDLLIIAPSEDRPIDRRLKIKKLLLEYERNIGLDLLIYTPDEYNMLVNEPSSFVHSIVKHGLKLYDQKAT